MLQLQLAKMSVFFVLHPQVYDLIQLHQLRFLLIPSINEILSSSVLRGGDSFKKVLNSPISFSFRARLLIDTPVVKFILFFVIN